jgi:ATP-dependent DNA helicase RecQ
MHPKIAYLDLEVSDNGRIVDIGCLSNYGDQYHGNSLTELNKILSKAEFICGHNLMHHDLKYLKAREFNLNWSSIQLIDTLFLSPLLFPSKPYHSLLKDDKLDPENNNNPINDAQKCKDLLEDEILAFRKLPVVLQNIYNSILRDQPGFQGFFELLGVIGTEKDLSRAISEAFEGRLCNNASIKILLITSPVALAYSLSLIIAHDRTSVFPPWVIKQFPDVHGCFQILRNTPCLAGCPYCSEKLNAKSALKHWFGFDQFREFEGVPLQEQAIDAALKNKSLLTIFPTGGGKSLTFQLPALISGEAERGLTVIISPLQSLMKDQVDKLEGFGITDAVTINGLLDPIERAKSIDRVAMGGANMLYISPESLRSNTIERLLQGRHISRFVIDEAHCFSAWGQDFRVDYLYIGDFIKKLEQKKNLTYSIPVSCFTATAKPKVIEDIKDYFKEKLDLELELFTTRATRANLQYKVLQLENESEKYNTLRALIEENDCPTIVYVSRTKKSELIAEKLIADGHDAKCYHGKMDTKKRLEYQNSFMKNETNIMVATSAFGMGVDKDNVGMIVHYDISDSLENYIQEAGRAGRSEKINASCYVLYNEEDLNKHFALLNQTKLTLKEIQEIWKAVKELTKTRRKISNSALEIARKAGWDDEVADIESRILTAISALENAGYLTRGNNSPRVFATGITCKSAQEAIERIDQSKKIIGEDKTKAVRIIKKLFAAKNTKAKIDSDAEFRVDYIADQLGIPREDVIHIINLLREEKILADSKDLRGFIKQNPKACDNAIQNTVNYFALESFLLNQFSTEPTTIHLKELNESASAALGDHVTPAHLKTLLNIWSIQGWIKKDRFQDDSNYYQVTAKMPISTLREKLDKRSSLTRTVVQYLFDKAQNSRSADPNEVEVEFSILELQEQLKSTNSAFTTETSFKEIEDLIFYLSRIESIKVEGGFMVLYNRLLIERKERNPYVKYKKEDYQKLEEFYSSKIQQIHIVGEYAKRMIQNYIEALTFVNDYFQLNYVSFIGKYFPGSKKDDLKLKVTRKKFEQIYAELSTEQSKIMNDNESQFVVVAAGPGSGKTRILVHKLASLLQMEDVKHEQLLMLTFSRAASHEFKSRLQKLIGNAAYYVEIKTFHSYCFDLLGRVGTLEKSNRIIEETISKIRGNEILLNRITKSVLVIDEAQDINSEEFGLIRLLVEKNEDMRVIIVGDDDQNIFEWRGSSKDCMMWFLEQKKAKAYTLLDNHRSKEEIVIFSNRFLETLKSRLKTKQIISKKGTGGRITIVEHSSKALETPLIEDINQTELTGSTCVLTRTNQESSIIAGLLRKSGYPVKLIQGNDSFSLSNMLELRHFSNAILNSTENVATVDLEEFDDAKNKFKRNFENSMKREISEHVINQFLKLNPKRIYKSDWRAFLAESKLEDFYPFDSETIYVSTIHKAKGKEFDNIFLLLNNHSLRSEEDKRLLYVGITRAKNNVCIHYNQQYLNYRDLPIQYQTNQNEYSSPESITLMLGFEDVWLGFFDNDYRQRTISELIAGMPVIPNEASNGCLFSGIEVLRFSNSFKTKVKHWLDSGYKIKSAAVQFIVYWKTDDGKEIRIILPEITLEKV